MDTFPQPLFNKKPDQERLARISTDLRNLKELFDQDIPDQYLTLWEQCRDEIEMLEEEFERGLSEADKMGELDEDSQEFFEGFIVSFEDQIQEVYSRLKDAENFFYQQVPQEALNLMRDIRRTLNNHSN